MKSCSLECKCACYVGPRRPLNQDLRENFPDLASLATFSYASGPNRDRVGPGNVYQINVPGHSTVYVETTGDVYGGDGFQFTTMKGHFEAGSISFIAKEFSTDGKDCNVLFMILSVAKSSDQTSYLRYTMGGMGVDMYGQLLVGPLIDERNLDPNGAFLRGGEYWAQTASWINMLRNFAKRHCGGSPKITVNDKWLFP